jgi:hypothetical protein
MHFAYGSAWGIPRGLMSLSGMNGLAATGMHFAAVQATAMGMLPALKITSPPTESGKKELSLELTHHLVYAIVMSLAFHLLDTRSERAELAA